MFAVVEGPFKIENVRQFLEVAVTARCNVVFNDSCIKDTFGARDFEPCYTCCCNDVISLLLTFAGEETVRTVGDVILTFATCVITVSRTGLFHTHYRPNRFGPTLKHHSFPGLQS